MGAGAVPFLERALKTEEKVEQQPPEDGLVEPFAGC